MWSLGEAPAVHSPGLPGRPMQFRGRLPGALSGLSPTGAVIPWRAGAAGSRTPSARKRLPPAALCRRSSAPSAFRPPRHDGNEAESQCHRNEEDSRTASATIQRSPEHACAQAYGQRSRHNRSAVEVGVGGRFQWEVDEHGRNGCNRPRGETGPHRRDAVLRLNASRSMPYFGQYSEDLSGVSKLIRALSCYTGIDYSVDIPDSAILAQALPR